MHLQTIPTSNKTKPSHRPDIFNGGAIIDENGKEVPITEEMLQKAFKRLEKAWVLPRKK
ncbi:hypothetical protein KCM76_13405 [Zooshikella marina]|uniref:PA1571 family protein n=1 Tax=Zooshikella ganghwensis TaxID=202772 RepID=UPI0003FC0E73|nr:PA1571 family protein [Zooshikella ganghwensis]MBU2706985.1 hypothetical protein [Zooshikella ganghwensis]